jgi:NADH-quinone oxidoreductase subunit J
MEGLLFYVSGAITLIAALLVVTRTNASHALLYMLVSVLAMAVVFFSLGAPFAAALQIVVYAGAIMVLFLFVVMMLALGRESNEQERRWMPASAFVGPTVLVAVLFAQLAWVLLLPGDATPTSGREIHPKDVGLTLFGPYVLAVELAAFLLLAAMVGAYHIGRRYMRARRGGDA